jgi:hypothetical protein
MRPVGICLGYISTQGAYHHESFFLPGMLTHQQWSPETFFSEQDVRFASILDVWQHLLWKDQTARVAPSVMGGPQKV